MPKMVKVSLTLTRSSSTASKFSYCIFLFSFAYVLPYSQFIIATAYTITGSKTGFTNCSFVSSDISTGLDFAPSSLYLPPI